MARKPQSPGQRARVALRITVICAVVQVIASCAELIDVFVR